eukprot:g16054.t1
MEASEHCLGATPRRGGSPALPAEAAPATLSVGPKSSCEGSCRAIAAKRRSFAQNCSTSGAGRMWGSSPLYCAAGSRSDLGASVTAGPSA